MTEAITAVALVALLTDWVSVPLLVVKVVSPAYVAVRTWLPTAKLVVVKLAVLMPPLVVKVPWPRLVAPSEKITTPLGLPLPVPDTVAVKMTFWPQTEGLAEETTAVVLVAFVIVCVMAVDRLVLKLVSPL